MLFSGRTAVGCHVDKGENVYARCRKRTEPAWVDLPTSARVAWDAAVINVDRVFNARPSWWTRVLRGEATPEDFEAERLWRLAESEK